MKLPRLCLALIISCFALGAVARAADTSTRVYEMRTYIATPGKTAALLARFRDHTVRLFEKHGMVNVAYWVPTDAKDGSADKLVYILAHASRDAAKASWKSFIADPEWKAAAAASEKDGKILASLESVYLTPTDFSAPMDAGNGAGKRVFELRTYTAADGKLADLDARFRNHTMALFKKHGITNLGYFHPVDADKGAANTLIYFLAYPSRDAATAAWKNFREDAAWTKARTESEKNGKLTAKTSSVFLQATDFSKVK